MTWQYFDDTKRSLRFDEDYIESEIFTAYWDVRSLLGNVYAYHLRVRHLDDLLRGATAHLFVTEPAFLRAMSLRILDQLRTLTGRLSDRQHLRSLTYLDALLYGEEDAPLRATSDEHASRTRRLRGEFHRFEMKMHEDWMALTDKDPEYLDLNQDPLAWPVQTFDYTAICEVVVNTLDKLVDVEDDYVIELGDETVSLIELLNIKRGKDESADT